MLALVGAESSQLYHTISSHLTDILGMSATLDKIPTIHTQHRFGVWNGFRSTTFSKFNFVIEDRYIQTNCSAKVEKGVEDDFNCNLDHSEAFNVIYFYQIKIETNFKGVRVSFDIGINRI